MRSGTYHPRIPVFAEFPYVDEMRDAVAASDDDAARNLFEYGAEEFQQTTTVVIPYGDVAEKRYDQYDRERYGDQRTGIFPAEHRQIVHADHQILRIGVAADAESLETAGRDDLLCFDRFPASLR